MLCYILAAVTTLFAMTLLIVVSYTDNPPDFMRYPIHWILSNIPKDNDILLLFCFIALVAGIVLVPAAIVFGLIKRGQYLKKQERKVRRRRPISTL